MRIYLKADSGDMFRIYQKPTNCDHWIKWFLKRYKTDEITGKAGEQDVYRMSPTHIVDIDKANPSIKGCNFRNDTVICGDGNWERALYIRTDTGDKLIGGIHGFEFYNRVVLTVDGVDVLPITDKYYEGEMVRAVVSSDLYYPYDYDRRICTVLTKYLWYKNSMEISSRYNWLDDVTIPMSYAAMFPVSQNTDVSEYGQLLDDYDTEEFSLGATYQEQPSPGAIYWNSNNSLRMKMRFQNVYTGLNNFEDTGTIKSHFKSTSTYNKLYVTRNSDPNNLEVSKGDVWNHNVAYYVYNEEAD